VSEFQRVISLNQFCFAKTKKNIYKKKNTSHFEDINSSYMLHAKCSICENIKKNPELTKLLALKKKSIVLWQKKIITFFHDTS
jgi:hypothetical protein